MITQRQLQVLRLYAQGKRTIDIANELSISCRTVEFHLVGARKSLNAVNSVNAVAIAAKKGLISVVIMISALQGMTGYYPVDIRRPPACKVRVRKIDS